jgi:hypothetical protein
MDIKYSKNVLWLKPYVDAVKNIVNLDKICSVKGYRVALDKNPVCDGRTTKWQGRRKKAITIRIWEKEDDKHLRSRYEAILETLAHELAHIDTTPFGCHSPEHFKLKSRIALRFATVMKKEGITDHSVRFSPKVEQKHIEKHIEKTEQIEKSEGS